MSADVNARPRRIGMPIALKKSGDTAFQLKCAVSFWCVSSNVMSLVKREESVNGMMRAAAAFEMPGMACSSGRARST
jgi:hypothetical protein